jgi:hypothetical protein
MVDMASTFAHEACDRRFPAGVPSGPDPFTAELPGFVDVDCYWRFSAP